MNTTGIAPASEYVVEIGGVSLRAKTAADDFLLAADPVLGEFAVQRSNVDIDITVHYEEPPDVDDSWSEVFDSGGLWRLYEAGDDYALTMTSPAFGSRPYRVVRLRKSLESGELHIRPSEWAESGPRIGDRPVVVPFEHPLDELLVLNKLANGDGVDLHGCAVADDGRGLLFVGSSGAGKSTIAGLWQTRRVKVLSDDRLIVRPTGGRPRVYGTPWHGDARVAMAERAPLEAVYFLAKGGRNELRPLGTVETMSRLLVCCFPTFYFKDAMSQTMEVLAQVAEAVPAYEFSFLPDESAVEFITSQVVV